MKNTPITQDRVVDLTTDLAAKYVKPETGIPSSDLASAVQTSLGKADTALQSGTAISTVSGLQAALDARATAPAANVASRYYSAYASQQLSTLPLTANTLYFLPLSIPASFSATRIGINVTSALTGSARLGIYNDVAGVPSGSPLLDAGTVDIGATGEKEITITQSLSAGNYWLAIVANAAATITAENLGTSGLNVPNLGTATGSGNAITHLTQSHSFAALPAVGTLTVATTKTPPRVWLRDYTAPPEPDAPTIVASSVNKSYPSGILSGDLIMVWTMQNGAAPALLSGFTNIAEGITGNASRNGRLQYKIASGSETGAISDRTTTVCAVLRGGDAAKISYGLYTPTLTVGYDNSKVVVFGMHAAVPTGTEITPPSGYTRYANDTPGGSGIRGFAVIALDAARDTGNFTHGVTLPAAGSLDGNLVFSVGAA